MIAVVRWLGVLVTVTLWLASHAGSANAASPAEDAFQEGRRLLSAGQTDEACARFADSYAMVASSGTLLNLALCHETQGKTATAWNEYKSAARLARNQGREDRAVVADGKAQSLEPNLARVTTTAAQVVPGLRVATQAGPLGAGGLGVEVPIDPGTHELIATAPGHLPWKTTLEVAEGDQITQEIPRLEAEPLPASARLGLARSGADAEISPRRSSLTLYLAGGGAVALVAGTVVWSIAYAKFQSVKNACTVGCTKSEHDGSISEIGTLKNVATVSWVVGGGLVMASGVSYLLHRKQTATTVAFDPNLNGVSLHGTF